MPKIKICGVTRSEDIGHCIDLAVDFVGLNLWEGSPRSVSVSTVVELTASLPSTLIPVAVCVWDSKESVEMAMDTGLSHLQIHKTPLGWNKSCLKQNRTIIRAVSAIPQMSRSCLPEGDYILLDTPSDKVGGSGKAFDWKTLTGLTGQPNLFLAGGLNPFNVGEAISTLHPYAVDIASGVEETPGIKDLVKLCAFVEAVRQTSS